MVKAGTFITPSETGTSVSGNVLLRRYLGRSQRYVEAGGSFGASPVDSDSFEEDFRRLRSWSVSVGAQIPLSYRILVGASLGYDFEAFSSRTQRRVSTTVSLSYEF
jgi:YaiO family outer membrane protein